MSTLTSGAARALFGSLNDAASIAGLLKQGIVVQLLDFKPLGEGTPKEKFRITISDGVESAKAMLSPKYNEMCKDGRMASGALVKITEASCVAVSDSRVVVVKELEVVSAGGASAQIIGSPVLITATSQAAPVPAAPAAAEAATAASATAAPAKAAETAEPALKQETAQPAEQKEEKEQDENKEPTLAAAATAAAPTKAGATAEAAAAAGAAAGAACDAGADVSMSDAQPAATAAQSAAATPEAAAPAEPASAAADEAAQAAPPPAAGEVAASEEAQPAAPAATPSPASAEVKTEPTAAPMEVDAAEPVAAVAAAAAATGAAASAAAAPPAPFADSPPKAAAAQTPSAAQPDAASPPPAAAVVDVTAGTLDATPVQKDKAGAKRAREPDGLTDELLTSGAVLAIFEGAGNAPVIAGILAKKPTLQVIETRRVDGVTEKYRLCLSDGSHYLNALCHPKINADVKAVQTLGTIRVVAGVCNIVSGRRVLILNQIEVISAAPLSAGRLGNSVDVERAAYGLAEMKTPSPHHVGAPSGMGGLVASRAISMLTPYVNSWAIKGRITMLEEPRAFSRGKVMTIQIADESDEIRATLWAEAVDAYEGILKEGGVYVISSNKGSSIKMANKKYSTLKNQYELSLGADARIVRCADEDGPQRTMLALLDVVPIAQLAAKPSQAAVDVVGIVLEVGPVQKITAKSGNELAKRTLLICDQSNATIELSLWDPHTGKVDESMVPGGSGNDASGGILVISVKGARLSDWNTKSLATGRGTQVALNPERSEADEVRAWWAARGSEGVSGLTPLSINERGTALGAGGSGALPSERLELCELTLDSPAMLMASQAGKPLYATSRLWVQKLQTGDNRPLWYAACPKCSRKLHGDEGAGWSCESCSTSVADADFRYILSAVACDHTGRQWLSLFNETGIKFLGQKAGDLKALRDVNEDGFNSAIASHTWAGPFSARLRVKSETWNNEAKVRINALDLSPCDFKAEAAAMLADIKSARL